MMSTVADALTTLIVMLLACKSFIQVFFKCLNQAPKLKEMVFEKIFFLKKRIIQR